MVYNVLNNENWVQYVINLFCAVLRAVGCRL